MFQKLLSNLPFNPSLIDQVSFYAKRLRSEASLRRLGFIFASLALVVQFFAVMSPAEASLQQSPNDIIPNGFKTKAEAVDHCNQNHYDFATILNTFGISCAALASDQTQVKHITSIDYNRELYSLGRVSQGAINPRTHKPTDEQTIIINGLRYPVYLRHLWSWDSGNSSSYTALLGTRSNGTPFMVLFSCGNIVIIGRYIPPPVPPRLIGKSCLDVSTCLEFSKSAANQTQNIANANGTTANANDVINYSLHTHNISKVSIKDYIIQEDMTHVLNYASVTDFHGGHLNSGNVMSWPPVTITPGETVTKQITVRVKDPIPSTNTPDSDPDLFDLLLKNTYGNTVTIKLPSPLPKTIEKTTKALPNTGPGSSLIIGFGIASVVGYLFARSRLMAKELGIVRNEYTSSGGA